MTTRQATLASLTMLALALGTSGCKSSAERAAVPILEKNTAARGGLERWRAVKTMSWSGTLDAGERKDPVKLAMSYLRQRTEPRAGPRRAAERAATVQPATQRQIQLPFVMELERPRKSRLEITFQGQTAVQVYDGAQGWKLRPFLGRHEVEPFTSEELRVASQQTELDGPLLDPASKGEKVELEGTDKIEGRDAYKLKVSAGKDQVRHVWVDAETFLEVRVDGTRRLDGKSKTVFTSLRDYRPIDGLMIPHLLETSVEGMSGSERIVIERVRLNPELSASRFTKPI